MTPLTRLLAPLAIALALVVGGCAKAPPTLVTPQGVAAYQNLQILHALDLVRDVAQDASHTSPPILDRAAALKVTNWHTSAVKLLDARSAGWRELVIASLDEVVANLVDKDKATLAPYVALVKSVLASF